MADSGDTGVPQSPETQAPPVREQLDQEMISHDGSERDAGDAEQGTGGHFGAVETEVTPNMPPVSGPADLIAPEGAEAAVVDPADEIRRG